MKDVDDCDDINGFAVDHCLGSVECIQNFVVLMDDEWKLSYSS